MRDEVEVNSGPKGLDGLFAIFIITLALHAFFYLKFSYDLIFAFEDILLGFIPLAVATIAVYTLVVIFRKDRDAVLLSKVFLVANLLFWIISTAILPFLFPSIIVAIAYGAFSWAYLDSSRRVKNTFVC